MSFEDSGLEAVLLEAVAACGFEKPTPIQEKAIPHILAGEDVMASAQTGTGKTAAFVLPALHRLLNTGCKNGPGPRVLVLTPTRELAMQVNDNVEQLGKYMNVKAGLVVGGMPYPPQIRMLSKATDFIVATPGRLIDHMTSGNVNFSRVEMLILDEADRMLDMGFIDDVQTIIRQIPDNRQTLLFSATFEGKVQDVANTAMRNPFKIQLAENRQRHKSIKQFMHVVDNGHHKEDILKHYIKQKDVVQAVIFVATKRAADELSSTIARQGYTTSALHGDMGQGHRKRTIEGFRKGNIRFLVATDVAARGLDIKGVSHVINWELPQVAEDYIHRIGRTGRGGDTGIAISLVDHRDWDNLVAIERLTGQTIERKVIEGLEPVSDEPKPGSGKSNNRRNSGRNKSSRGSGKKGGNRKQSGSGSDSRSDSRSESKSRSESRKKPGGSGGRKFRGKPGKKSGRQGNANDSAG